MGRIVKALGSAMLVLVLASSTQAQVAVRGETVYTMAGAPLRDGVVLIRDGKIERVGPAAQVQVPAGYRTLTAKVVTPGLIDAYSVVGLAGHLNQSHDQMQVERSSAIQPELRAMDAYNPRERLVDYLREFGVTTINTGHGPGALVSGQTMVVKTTGETVEEALVVPTSAVAAHIGEGSLFEGGRAPGTRAKEIAMLRGELVKAQEGLAKRERPARRSDAKPVDGEGGDASQAPSRDLRQEVWFSVLRREVPLLVTANRAHDIMSVLRLAKEFNIRVILSGAAEAYLVVDHIKAAGTPVILHATMARANGETENLSFETASMLRKAGVPVALQSGYEGYVPKTRVVLFEAALAAAHGLTLEEALATVTSEAARVLGISNRVGSLEAGKDGDVVLFDGDPFEYTTHVTGVVVNGRVVSTESR